MGIVVEWLDPSYQRGEVTLEEFDPEVVMTTVGLLAKDNDGTLSVALEFCEKDETFRSVIHIPKVLVRRSTTFVIEQFEGAYLKIRSHE